MKTTTFYSYLMMMAFCMLGGIHINAQTIEQVQNLKKAALALDDSIRNTALSGRIDILKERFLGDAQALLQKSNNALEEYKRQFPTNTTGSREEQKMLKTIERLQRSSQSLVFRLSTYCDLLNEPDTKLVADSMRFYFDHNEYKKAHRIRGNYVESLRQKALKEAAVDYKKHQVMMKRAELIENALMKMIPYRPSKARKVILYSIAGKKQ